MQAWTKLADDQQALAGAAIKDELEGLKQSLQQTVVTVQSINNNVRLPCFPHVSRECALLALQKHESLPFCSGPLALGRDVGEG